VFTSFATYNYHGSSDVGDHVPHPGGQHPPSASFTPHRRRATDGPAPARERGPRQTATMTTMTLTALLPPEQSRVVVLVLSGMLRAVAHYTYVGEELVYVVPN
jgi:hypothetical protein